MSTDERKSEWQCQLCGGWVVGAICECTFDSMAPPKAEAQAPDEQSKHYMMGGPALLMKHAAQAAHSAPVAWLFSAKRGGRSAEWSSVSPDEWNSCDDTMGAPEWRTVKRTPLVEAGPSEQLWPKADHPATQTPRPNEPDVSGITKEQGEPDMIERDDEEPCQHDECDDEGTCLECGMFHAREPKSSQQTEPKE